MKFWMKKPVPAIQPLKNFARFFDLTPKELLLAALGNLTMAFAIINIHEPSHITEGGVLGLNLLLQKSFGANPALTAMALDYTLYFLGFLLLERGFLKKAMLSTVLFSSFYGLFDAVGPVLPSLEAHPFFAALAGGLMIGTGCGMIVTRGFAAGGDDCFALIVEKHTPLTLAQAYVISDMTVLSLSALVYLPLQNVLWSFLTTLVSSYVIGQFEIHVTREEVAAGVRHAAQALQDTGKAGQSVPQA